MFLVLCTLSCSFSGFGRASSLLPGGSQARLAGGSEVGVPGGSTGFDGQGCKGPDSGAGKA